MKFSILSKYVILATLVFIINKTFGGNRDSLILLTQSENLQVQFDAFTELGDDRNIPAKERITYSLQGLELAKILKDKNKEAEAHLSLGSAYTDAGEYDKSVFSLQNAVQIYDSLNQKLFSAKALDVLGRTYFYLKQPEKSLNILEKSLRIKQNLGNQTDIAFSYIALGNVNAIMGALDKALDYFLKAKNLLEKENNTIDISKVYNNIANIHFAKGDMQKVLPFRQKALKMDRLLNDERQISFKTYNLAEYYLAVKQAHKALPYLNESLQLSKKLQDKELTLDNYKLLTEYYILVNVPQKAQEYLKESFTLSEELFSKELSKEVGNMQALYETEKVKREKQIADLTLSKTKQNKNILLSLFTIAVLFIGVLFFIYYEKQKFNRILKIQVKQKTNELEQTNLELNKHIQLLIKAKEKAEESDHLKTAFLANMSHEIRTPMNGILGFTELLLTPNLSKEDNKNFINIVHKSGQRLLKTVNDIIETAKIEAGQIDINLTKTDINKHIEEILDSFGPTAESKRINLFYKQYLPTEQSFLATDPVKLDSILTNLINNAIKYTQEGNVSIACNFKDFEIEFCIKDTGIGIPKERQQAIFERFIQADIADKDAYQGSGLGLSITKAYVEKLGGKIWLESEEGEGSNFYFTLPLHPDTQIS